MKSDSTTDEWN